MPLRKPFKTLLILSAVLFTASCAGPRIKGPKVQICFVQEQRGGIECTMKDDKQVFLRWSEIQAKFLSGFNHFVLTPDQDYMDVVNWGHRK